MALTWQAPKDPDETKDYVVDWTTRLSGDTIETSLWIAPDGIVIDSEENTTTETTIWLSGGTLGDVYELVNRVTTAGGRTLDQTCKLKCKAL